MFKELDVIIPSFRSPDLTRICVASFERFRPADLWIRYVVVENSDDASYRELIEGASGRPFSVVWVQNPTDERESRANAIAIIEGRKHVCAEWAFVAHNDVCVTSPRFYDELRRKTTEGHGLVGTVLDPIRVNAIHVSGYLLHSSLLSELDMWPIVENGQLTHDVGDMATVVCRERGIPHFCFRNTFNDPSAIGSVPERYREFHVDRCLSEDERDVIFMHLGRGSPKTLGTYGKPNRVTLREWVEFCQGVLEE